MPSRGKEILEKSDTHLKVIYLYLIVHCSSIMIPY